MVTPDYHAIVAITLMLTGESYFVLGFLTLKDDVKSPMRRAYMIVCACIGIWSVCYAVMTIANNPGVMRFFWAAGYLSMSLFFLVWLDFQVHLTGYRVPHYSFWKKVLFMVLGALALACVLFGNVSFVDTLYGNQFIYSGALFKAAIISQMFMAVLYLLQIIRLLRSARLRRKRVQAIVFLITTSIGATLSIFTDLILPGFLSRNTIPLAAVAVFRTLFTYIPQTKFSKDLMSIDELTTMPGDRCILQLRGLRPFFSPKYRLQDHPNYKYTAEANKHNAFDVIRLATRSRVPGPDEVFAVYSLDAIADDCLADEDLDILDYDDVDDPEEFA